MIKNFKLFEYTTYYNLHGDDDYDITKVERDSDHDYQYCDGILYELTGGNEIAVNIDEVEHTDENMFYQDQIERYVEYFEDGGVSQTFPVSESKLAHNLEEMLEYLDESENFDATYEILKGDHEKLFNIFMGSGGLWGITSDPDEYGFGENSPSDIRIKEDLEEYYNEENEEYDEDLLLGFEAIIQYFEDNSEYSLTDFNHRFVALKEMGKTRIIVDID